MSHQDNTTKNSLYLSIQPRTRLTPKLINMKQGTKSDHWPRLQHFSTWVSPRHQRKPPTRGWHAHANHSSSAHPPLLFKCPQKTCLWQTQSRNDRKFILCKYQEEDRRPGTKSEWARQLRRKAGHFIVHQASPPPSPLIKPRQKTLLKGREGRKLSIVHFSKID